MQWIKIESDTVIPTSSRGILCLYKGLHDNTLIEAYVRNEHGFYPWLLGHDTFDCEAYKYYCVIDEELFPLPEL